MVQAREGKAGGVADAVRPRGSFQQVGVSAEDGCQAAGPGGDALAVGPAAREGFLEASASQGGNRHGFSER